MDFFGSTAAILAIMGCSGDTYPDTASVHTHPGNSAADPDIFKSALQSGKKYATNPITCGRVDPDIFESDDPAKSCPVSYRTINQYGITRCSSSFSMAHALNTFYCRGALGARVNLGPSNACGPANSI